ncbi:hypothetical protein [Citrobacter werkmanii]|uniref:hypothetical protein n=1 Tax=Citrobacter werkmanii TaxID=67827 RepID=UPI000501F9A2|nr:hypothetical protein [Citrobacter werkmanii]UCA26036.1 hypothetical protein LA356_04750 [Citrobacter werkmanii]GAL43029.1 hypothetical protein CIWKM_02_00730 [Citrobacter werkmanii NBRC 105721]
MKTNHPAHGPVSLDRLHQISEILSKAAAQSDGGNLGYAMADAVKVIDGVIAAFGAEPVGTFKKGPCGYYSSFHEDAVPLYTAPPPAPVVPLPDAVSVLLNHLEDVLSDDAFNLIDVKTWNAVSMLTCPDACRAAMLKAGNHTEQHLDMVVHSGDAKEKVDCRLPFDQWLSQQNEPIDVDCGCVTTEAFYHWLRVAYEAGNSPVTQDGYVLVQKKLTAENGAKSVLSGEFSEKKFINCPECFGDDDCETCDGSGRIEITVPVTWTTIKAIWAKGVEHFSAAPRQEAE